MYRNKSLNMGNQIKDKEIHPKIRYKKAGCFLWLGITFAIVCWILTLIYYFIQNNDLSNTGSFGDTFGSINALFTGMAFALLIYTAYLQRLDLIATLSETTESRKALQKQNSIGQQQVEAEAAKLIFEKLKYRNLVYSFLEYHEHKIESNGQTSLLMIALKVRGKRLKVNSFEASVLTTKSKHFPKDHNPFLIYNEGQLIYFRLQHIIASFTSTQYYQFIVKYEDSAGNIYQQVGYWTSEKSAPYLEKPVLKSIT